MAHDRFSETIALYRRVAPGQVGADKALLFACRCARTRLMAEYSRRGLDAEAVLEEYRAACRPKRKSSPMPLLSTPKPVVDG